MTYQTVLVEKRENIALITLSRPPGNAVSAQMAWELRDAARQVNADGETRYVILTGSGDSFCSGSDLEEVVPRETTAPPQAEELLESYQAAGAIASIQCPVLAAINGPATGQGLELALACDIRFASAAARFGLPHLSQGLIPWDGGTQRLARIVGRGKALEMLLLGETIDAQEAHRIQLVHRVMQPQELPGAALEAARRICRFAPIAARYAKEAILKGLDMALDQGLRLEGDLYFILQTTQDRMEGIRAFQERRTPRFEGR